MLDELITRTTDPDLYSSFHMTLNKRVYSNAPADVLNDIEVFASPFLLSSSLLLPSARRLLVLAK